MQRRIRRAFCSLKEHTSVSCAKIATVGGFCDLDVVFIKATSPDDLPFNEKYVHDIMKIFAVSPVSFREFALFFSRRFGKTECWRVALKSLLLLHRLLRSLPENIPFRAELLWARSNKYLTLYPCDFQDYSSSAAEDYTSFIRSYARLLDEAIDCSSNESLEMDQEKVQESFPERMKELGRMIEVLPQLQSLIDRVMDCRPTGAAERNFIVQSTMKHIIRDSFVCYTNVRKEIVVILDNLIQLPHRSCAEAFDIYKKAAIQANELCEFYDWSRSMGLCGAYEYPFVERIPLIQIRALGAFLNGMWQLTESSSSSSATSNSASNLQSSSTTSDDDDDENDKQLLKVKCDEGSFNDDLQKDGEMAPLIDFEADNHISWEALLEASLPLPPRNNFIFFPNPNNSSGYINQHGSNWGHNFYADQINNWQIQMYPPQMLPISTNPFHPNYIPVHHSSGTVGTLIHY